MTNLIQSLKHLYWKMLVQNTITRDNSQEIIEFAELVKNAKLNVVIRDYSVTEEQSSPSTKSEPIEV